MLIQFLISIISSYFVTKFSIPFLRSKIINVPNNRDSHIQPKPSGAGFTFVILSIFFGIINNYFIPLFCLPLAFIGLLDDKFRIPATTRFIFQIATVSILLKTSYLYNKYLANNISLVTILISLIIIFIGCSIINFTNFMDGIDGIVAGSMIIILGSAAYLSNGLLWPLIGGVIGFLFWNWSPSKVFMGDIGSTFLGAILFSEILNTKDINNGIGILLISIPLLLDAFICLLRRMLYKQQIFKAHRLHLYQRLYQAGWSHKKVASLYISVTLLISLFHIIIGIKASVFMIIPIIAFGFYLDRKIAIPFSH